MDIDLILLAQQLYEYRKEMDRAVELIERRESLTEKEAEHLTLVLIKLYSGVTDVKELAITARDMIRH